MNVTCQSCGRDVDHASPGCAEHARREADEIHRAHLASGGSAEHCPVCARPVAANRHERRQGMSAEIAALRATIARHEAAARVHAEERAGLCAELARVTVERDEARDDLARERQEHAALRAAVREWREAEQEYADADRALTECFRAIAVSVEDGSIPLEKICGLARVPAAAHTNAYLRADVARKALAAIDGGAK